ncbi:uncharacterized protein CC84DRAFT_359401 [Paraphaeosphaeria sporulosa]|uniref:Uncharacterized protein n=1 Tax=Paraphaeosphaeria sporulosa TaxID=1460663 RepID=A0A177BZV4_9PLEO|nr:uncharacterized protein CC84DRAFT_359401 [Paraphaeosphaeria sporulosa]OAG00088.1 hypothetical protein CC84DRAFT_359401 [Paraphaeosphaeria sporulosa]
MNALSFACAFPAQHRVATAKNLGASLSSRATWDTGSGHLRCTSSSRHRCTAQDRHGASADAATDRAAPTRNLSPALAGDVHPVNPQAAAICSDHRVYRRYGWRRMPSANVSQSQCLTLRAAVAVWLTIPGGAFA